MINLQFSIHYIYMVIGRQKEHTLYKNVKRLGIGEIARWVSNTLSFYKIDPYIVETREMSSEDNIKYKDLFFRFRKKII